MLAEAFCSLAGEMTLASPPPIPLAAATSRPLAPIRSAVCEVQLGQHGDGRGLGAADKAAQQPQKGRDQGVELAKGCRSSAGQDLDHIVAGSASTQSAPLPEWFMTKAMAKKMAAASTGRGARLSHLRSEVSELRPRRLEKGKGQQGADQNPEIGLPEQAHLFRRAGDDLQGHGQFFEGQVKEGQEGGVDQKGKDGQEEPGRDGRPQRHLLLGSQIVLAQDAAVAQRLAA